MLIEYEATNGKSYALHPAQVRGFEGNHDETKVLATIGGVALTFRVAKPFKVVLQEWRKEMEHGGEE
jgi:hypothetical protein